MTPEHFKRQMQRLSAQFPTAYSQERVNLLWREMDRFSDPWFTRVVDKFIGECRQAPLVSDFRTEMSFERERNWSVEKKQHENDAKEFYNLASDHDMRGSMIKTIIDRMNHNVPDDVWGQFVQGISKLTAIPICRSCDGTGLAFTKDSENYEFVSRCDCTAGAKQPKAYPRLASRREL